MRCSWSRPEAATFSGRAPMLSDHPATINRRSAALCELVERILAIVLDGRTYAGAYSVDRKVLMVTTSFGKKSAPVGHQVSHEILAHQLLHELVQEEKGRKGSRL